ncbi:DUF4998 domain-containing protein [uncultured Proteiniphilum sp.]|uniref:DUF4998 domain-containing protein n=1 Tax=uncultured Proteiniphilum sp. TaxID=497637 RepID=UPI00262B19AE|nr:DUF4998 domain-containing protein [uncultured Proteiniphilum sp.]
MKKIQTIFLGILTVCVYLLFPGCSDMNDIHQQYLDREKTFYLGMTDSLVALSGEGRIKLKWYVNADPKIEQTVIYWNMRQDSVVKTFLRKEKGIQADSIIIDNLAEGTYSFELFNKNTRGDRSLYSTVQGISYGDNYRATLKNRAVTTMKILAYDKEKQASDIEITWGTRLYGILGMKISYKKRSSGEHAVVFVRADEPSTVLPDVGNRLNSVEDILEISTLYLLDNTIDTLSTYPLKEQICIYSASGTRSDYGSNGILTGRTSYSNIIKILSRVSALTTTDVYDCNRVAESPNLSNTLFRLMFSSTNNIKTEGYFNGLLNTISNVEEGVFIPEQQKLTLKYQILKSGGSYSIVEEEFVPSDISFPVVPQKVYSIGENKNGHFFTQGEDLLQLDKSGNLWVYKPQADKTFGTPSLIASGWTNYASVFYLPNKRIMRFDLNIVDCAIIEDDNYTLRYVPFFGSGWSGLSIDRLMPFKDFALIMTNTSGVLKKIGINQSNAWVGGFVDIGTGFKDYWKIVPYENSLLAIDKSGDLWHMALSDDFVLGSRVKIGSGWNKYLDVIKQGTALLCLDNNGDLWRYDFNPDLSWNIE